MSFPGTMHRGRLLCALACLALAMAGASAQQTITVTTNKDLNNAQSLGFGKSLRDAINEANAVPGTDPVTINFDPNVFVNNGAGAANTIIVGDQTLTIYSANFPWAMPPQMGAPGSGVFPLPVITRSNVTILGDQAGDGVPDVTIDFSQVSYVQPSMGGFFRAWGLWIANSPAGPDNVTLAWLNFSTAAPNPLTLEDSVPAVQVGLEGSDFSGTGHSIYGCTFAACAIGIEANLNASSEKLYIGSTSSSGAGGPGTGGYGNRFSSSGYAGLVIRSGAGQVVVQNNSFTGNGTALYDLSGGIVVGVNNTGPNLIGGTINLAGNSITGNTTNGVVVLGSGANTLQQNTITGNTRNGVRIRGSGANNIGGSAAQAGNTISTNGTGGTGYNHAGLWIDSAGNGANVIQGNTFNGNGGAGLQIDGDGNNVIGGTAAGSDNSFTNNGSFNNAEFKSGIVINGDNLNDGNNTIQNNTITGNLHGISVYGSGTTTIGGTQAASSNTIASNTYNGIRLSHNGTVNIKGNLIGSTGGNGVHGIEILSNYNGTNNIGGTSAAERNIISGNISDGIAINGGGANNIYGNYIGVNQAGTAALANHGNGILMTSTATGLNTIGGSAPGQRNVISGNNGIGIAMQNTPVGAQNIIQGNYIGTNAAATGAIGNVGGGVVVESASSAQTIGGSNLGEGNVIAGNGSHGIRLGGGSGSTGGTNTGYGNLIGAVPVTPASWPVDPRLTVNAALRNSGDGIIIGTDASSPIQIGGSSAYAGNVIVNNTGRGIEAAGSGVLTCWHNAIGAGQNAASTFVAMANGQEGILISGSGANHIGQDGNDANNTYSNVISGNTGAGINIIGSGANQVVNNYIGTDLAATSAAGNGSDGVLITGTGNNLLQNNRIAGNTGNGANFSTPGTTTLYGNRIGRTASAEPAGFANALNGVNVPNASAGRLVLGGLSSGQPNTISGNTQNGVNLLGNVTNSVVGNLIGTDVNGATAVGNRQSGVLVQGTSVTPPAGGTVVTTTDILANTISGNQVYGVELISGTNTLKRNRIGTDAGGLTAVANGSDGVYLNDPNVPGNRQGVVIGQRAIANVDYGNVISGNTGNGVHIVQGGGDSQTDNSNDPVAGQTTDDVLIQNNRIGVNSGGTAAIANGGDGIRVDSTCNGRLRIGGTTEGDGNIISGNNGWGLNFQGQYSYNPSLAPPVDNTPLIRLNLIGTNVQGEVALPNKSGGVLVNVPAGALTNSPRIVPVGPAYGFAGVAPRPTSGFLFANLISGNTGPGLQCSGTAGRLIQGNYIGLEAFARSALGNGGDGIYVDNTVTGPLTIGGADDAKHSLRNLIAGNGGWGVDITGPLSASASFGSTILNNFLGCAETDVNPADGVPDTFTGSGNTAGGMLVSNGVAGGLVTVANNVIRSSGATGLQTTSAAALTVTANWVQNSATTGYFFGGSGNVTATGNTAVLNSSDGAALTGTGVLTLTGNSFRRNGLDGVVLVGTGTYKLTGNIVTDNLHNGVEVRNASGVVVGSILTGTTGDAANRNTIQFNGQDGILVAAGATNRLSDNLISDNGILRTFNAAGGVTGSGNYNGTSLGIHITAAPVPLGPPQLDYLLPASAAQTNPKLTAWTVTGTAPSGSRYVELYEAKDPNIANPDTTLATFVHEGQVYQFITRVGVDTITNRFTANLGVGSVNFQAADANHLVLTALAIDASGNTSQFARNTGKVYLANSTVKVSPNSIPADGVTTATATVTIEDVIGTKLPGVPNVVVTSSSLTPTQTSTTTDANGTVTATFKTNTRPSCQNSNVTIGATVGGTALGSTAILQVGVGSPANAGSAISASPTAGLTADGSAASTVTVTLKDGSVDQCPVSNVAANRVKIVQVVGGQVQGSPSAGVTINQPTAATNTAGQTTGTVTSTKSGTYTFAFTVDGVPFTDPGNGGALRTVNITFVAGPVDVQKSTFKATPASVAADGSSASSLELTLVDAHDNPVVGVAAANIDISASPATGVTITKGPATDANGQSTSTVVSTKPNTVTFVAKINGTALNATATVTFTVGQPTGNSTLDANPLQARPNGTDVITLTATVRDATNNPVPGVTVNILASTGTGVTVVGPSAPTDSNGQAVATATSTQAGAVTFTATALVAGNTITIGSKQVQFRLLDPDAAKSTLTATFDDPLLANGSKQAHCTLTILDALGGPIPGVKPAEVTVTASIPGASGVTVTGPLDASDASGRMTFDVSSTAPGTATISVVARSVSISQHVSAVFVPYMTQSYGPGLHMMGVPGLPAKPDPRDVLSALLPSLKLARWDGGQQKYLGWNTYSPADPSDPYNLNKNPFAMLAGRGFWLQLSSALTFTTVGTPTPSGPLMLSLSKGWNQVANPFTNTFPFSLADMAVYQNGNLVGPLTSSAAQALVVPYGWRWDPVTMYLLVVDPSVAGASHLSGSIEPGRGWWWLCLGDNVTVQLKPGTSSRAVQRAVPQPGSWLASIEASAADGQGQVLFGAGAQRLRAVLPPDAPVSTPVQVAFADGATRSASDVRVGPLTARQSWNLQVTSRQAGPVTVSWKGLSRALPSGHRCWLVDPTSGKRVLMNTRASYSYTGDAGTRALTVELDPHGQRTLDISGLQVSASRGRGRATGLTLTLTCPATITVTVKGLGGHVVRQFSVNGQTGTNTLSWDGRDADGRPVPAGTYTVEVTATTDDGEIARVTRALTVR